MEERTIFRIIAAIMVAIGFMFFAVSAPQTSDYYIGSGAIVFAAAFLYIVEFYNKQ